jgi:aerobic-type carbon monoxide dehydrogenase small subunit (CoxS/CutS family)
MAAIGKECGMTAVVEAFQELSRRYSIARRHHENMARCGSYKNIEDSLSAVQEIEAEVTECFRLMRAPAPERPWEFAR